MGTTIDMGSYVMTHPLNRRQMRAVALTLLVLERAGADVRTTDFQGGTPLGPLPEAS